MTHLLSNFDIIHTSMGCDNTSNKFVFQGDGVEVADAIFRKKCHHSWAFIYFTQIFNMIISWASSTLSVLGPRSLSRWLFLQKSSHRQAWGN